MSSHEPHWNKTPDEWCKECGEDWPCSAKQDQDFLASEIERLGYVPLEVDDVK